MNDTDLIQLVNIDEVTSKIDAFTEDDCSRVLQEANTFLLKLYALEREAKANNKDSGFIKDYCDALYEVKFLIYKRQNQINGIVQLCLTGK